ncbi:hypothetical protein [Photobacterium kishitanii]|uniref:Uncharacterized protein n=1 Tax=Photobacterium kishitanii TaxID=318456 RepID=A0A2T3KEG2_9GAMM|nr:hypothetical protein [Photobacterium kishitanii]PSU95706.1 hypothetical protein C9J27_17690 [Photobacterium kishitanii]
MNCNLYNILLRVYGSEAVIAKAFHVERAAHWRQNVPERIALLCHLSPLIPYTYNPSDFNRDVTALGLKIKK